jgi:predicted secreted protein
VVVTAADDGRLLNLRQGEKLRVVLADTAGTGYSWEIEHYDPKLLAPEGQRSEQEPQPTPQPAAAPNGQLVPRVVGGPMRVSFQFRVVGKGKGELRLRHWRTWEGPGSIDRRFKLALQVVG